ncbi:transposase [Kineosporia babensis]|uniref:Transposase n=1 Tax=Kineosporia babensis TaxID=499548 RepID=A0A9X1NKJ4_9ACTN|nr:transposase [Kineosporia babensis]
MKSIGARSWPEVTTDGTGVVSHAGTLLLRELAERLGRRAGLSEAADGLRLRSSGHDPGQILTDLAAMLAGGGEAISGMAALNDRSRLHGPVVSTATAWRGLDEGMQGEPGAARAAARHRAWLVLAELTGRMLPPACAAGRVLDYAVLDLEATLVKVRSDQKEQAAAHFRGGSGSIRCCAFWTTPTRPWPG